MKKYKYKPDYPKTIGSAIEMLEGMLEEAEEEKEKTDFLDGYKMGLRTGIRLLKVLK
jgi:hypothetical protein